MSMGKSTNSRRQLLGNVRRAVVKIGNSIFSDLPVARIRSLASDIALLRQGGTEVIVVTSGALTLGMTRLDLKRRPRHIPLLQAAASVGQVGLMEAYADALGGHRIIAGQVMLTRDDLQDPGRLLRARHTLMALLDYGVVPVINENDAIAIEEIIDSDNDLLSAGLPRLVEADLLVFLTSAEGIYAASPRKGGQVIPTIEDIGALAQRVNEGMSKGKVQHSLASKVRAAQTVATDGVPTLVASGIRPGVLANILDDASIGTLLLPSQLRRSRKRWIAEDLEPKGTIQVNETAYHSLIEGGHSLQLSGISRTEGHYQLGESVRLVDMEGNEFGRGLANYPTTQLNQIIGKAPAEVEKFLGDRPNEEVIWRDDLVIL